MSVQNNADDPKVPLRKKFDRLMENESLIRSAFYYSGIGIALVETDGAWLKVNPAVCKMLGYTEEEFYKTCFQEITYPDDLEKDLGYVEALLRGEMETYSMEKRYFRKDGRIVWALLTVSLVRDLEGTPQYFISQMQDISQLKQAEEVLRHSLAEKETLALQLENQLERVHEFNRIASHNLRAPVSNMLLYLDYLKETNLDGAFLDKMDDLRELVTEEMEIINDIHEVVNIKTTHSESTHLNLAEVVARIKVLLADKIEESDARIECDFSLFPQVLFSAVALDCIFLNLMSNALCFRSGKRPLVITISSYLKNAVPVIEFKDNGLGIDLEKSRNKVFKFRKTLHGQLSGRGVGLFLVKSHVESNGGLIEVSSQENVGTQFKICLNYEANGR